MIVATRSSARWWIGHALCACLVLACKSGPPSDEDLLERFVDEVTGEVDAALVERSLGYTDMAQLPLDVRVPHLAGVYDASRSAELASGYRQGMRERFYGTKLAVRKLAIELHGERADVRLALMTAVGPLHADIGLQKLTSGWKVSRVHVDR